jgi:hypothetical protein
MTQPGITYEGVLFTLSGLAEDESGKQAGTISAIQKCTYCNIPGHKESDCRKKKRAAANGGGGAAKSANRPGQKVKTGESKKGVQYPGNSAYTGCNKCGSKDHLAKQCPTEEESEKPSMEKKGVIKMISVARIAPNDAPIIIMKDARLCEEVEPIPPGSEQYGTAQSGGEPLTVTHTAFLGAWSGVKIIPEIVNNLVATSTFTRRGWELVITEVTFRVQRPDGEVLAAGTIVDDMPCLSLRVFRSLGGDRRRLGAVMTVRIPDVAALMELIHRRFAHLSNGLLLSTHQLRKAEGMGYTRACLGKAKTEHLCASCQLAKPLRHSYRKHPAKKELREGRIYVDCKSWPTMPDRSGGMKVVNFFVAEECPFVYIHPSEDRSADNVIKALKELKRTLTAYRFNWTSLHSDGANEYTDERVSSLLASWGIMQTVNSVESPEQNGRAEAIIKLICNMTLSVLIDSGLPRDFG